MLPMDRKKHFDTLFHAYYAKLFFYASGIVGNDGDAEDVVEEVFCDLWTHIDTMEMGERIQAFLYRAVFTRSLNMLKRNALRQQRVEAVRQIGDMRVEQIESALADPHESMENAEMRCQIDAAINALPEKCRSVFRMRYIEGKNNAEIAQVTGTSPRTVEAHIHNALKFLRKRLWSLTLGHHDIRKNSRYAVKSLQVYG